jgi:hypothetical protein
VSVGPVGRREDLAERSVLDRRGVRVFGPAADSLVGEQRLRRGVGRDTADRERPNAGGRMGGLVAVDATGYDSHVLRAAARVAGPIAPGRGRPSTLAARDGRFRPEEDRGRDPEIPEDLGI